MRNGRLSSLAGPSTSKMRGGAWLVAGLLLCVLFAGCGQNFGWYVVDPTLPGGRTNLSFMISGFWYTILLSFTALMISLPGALVIGLFGLSSNRILNAVYRVYVEVVGCRLVVRVEVVGRRL